MTPQDKIRSLKCELRQVKRRIEALKPMQDKLIRLHDKKQRIINKILDIQNSNRDR